MVKLAETILRSTKPSIAYSPCYKLAAFDGFQFVANVFWQLAYNGSGLNEVCLAIPFKFTTTLHRHISFKPLLWDVFLKISGGKS